MENASSAWLENCKITREAVIALAIGLIMASIIVFADLNFIRFIMHYFITLVHEFGHSLCAWLFGYFSIPAFDFTHGGGVAVTSENLNIGIRVGAYILLGWAVFTFRQYKLILSGLGLIIAILIISQLMKWDQLAITYMGHGTVAIMGGLFLFRGLSNVAVHHFVERILYFFLAFFTLLEEYSFTQKVIHNPEFRAFYFEGKDDLPNDFILISNDVHCSLNSALYLHAVVCFLVPFISYGIYVLAMRFYSVSHS